MVYIRGTLLSWIENFLSNRSQRVILDNKQSSSSDILSSVPQGTILAPLLFLLFINDISSQVEARLDYMLMMSFFTTTYIP